MTQTATKNAVILNSQSVSPFVIDSYPHLNRGRKRLRDVYGMRIAAAEVLDLFGKQDCYVDDVIKIVAGNASVLRLAPVRACHGIRFKLHVETGGTSLIIRCAADDTTSLHIANVTGFTAAADATHVTTAADSANTNVTITAMTSSTVSGTVLDLWCNGLKWFISGSACGVVTST